MTAQPHRVLLVEDHDLVRRGVVHAFERAADFEMVGTGSGVAEAERLHDRHRPEVVVVDLRLPDGDGLDLVRRLRSQRAEVGLVVLTWYAQDAELLAAMRAGASAFVAKDAPAQELVAAARHAVVAPLSFSAADLAAVLARGVAPPPRLTTKERQVLRLLADGHSVRRVAAKLEVGESTAKTHISRLYGKLDAQNRAQAVMQGVRAGLLDG